MITYTHINTQIHSFSFEKYPGLSFEKTIYPKADERETNHNLKPYS